MNIANKLTVLRMIMIPFFLYFFLASPGVDNPNTYRVIATVLFSVAAFTDFLDGHLARSRGLVTNFGKFLDPVADKLLVCSALIAMIQVDGLSSIVPIIIIARDFILTSFRMIAASEKVVIAADKWGKIKTVFQMLMIIFILISRLFVQTPILFWTEQVLIYIVIILTVMSCVSYIAKNKQVLRLDDI